MNKVALALLLIVTVLLDSAKTQEYNEHDPGDCFYSAIWNLIRAAIFRHLSRDFQEHLRDADADFTLQRQVQASPGNETATEKRCSLRLIRCTLWVKNEAKQLMGIPYELVDECDVLTFPYTIFRCLTTRQWVIGVSSGTRYPDLCTQGCQIAGFTKYHAFTGTENIASPRSWRQKLNVSLLSIAAAEAAPDSNPPAEIEWKIEDAISNLHLRQTQHGRQRFRKARFSKRYVQVYHMGVGDYQSEFKCLPLTWMSNAIDYFPAGMASDCRVEWLRNVNGSAPDLGVYRYGGKLYDRVDPIVAGNGTDCWEKMPIPPRGRERFFLIGMRFRVKTFTYLDEFSTNRQAPHIVSGSYLCSGEETVHQLLLPAPSSASFDDLTTKAIHRTYSTVPELHLCTPDGFINEFNVTRVVPDHWSPYGFLQLIPMIQLEFFRRELPPSYRDELSSLAQMYLHTESNNSKLFEPQNFGNFSCDGFYKGGFLEIFPLQWKFGMTCSNGSVHEVVYNSTELLKHPAVDTNLTQGRADFSCPAEHAVCGFEIQASRNDSRGKTVIALLGYYFKFICCPVRIQNSCSQQPVVRLELEGSRECVEITGQALGCSTTKTRRYSYMDNGPWWATQPNPYLADHFNRTRILAHFGIENDVRVEHLVEAAALGEGARQGMFGLTPVSEVQDDEHNIWYISSELFDFEATINASKPGVPEEQKQFRLEYAYRKPSGSFSTIYYPNVHCYPEAFYTNRNLVGLSPVQSSYYAWQGENRPDVGSDTNNGGSEAEHTHTFFGYGVQVVNDTRIGNQFLQPWFTFNTYLARDMISLKRRPGPTNFNYRLVNKKILNPFRPDFEFNVTFVVPPNRVGRYYRVVLVCGQWRVHTNSFRVCAHDPSETPRAPDGLEHSKVIKAKEVIQIYPDPLVLNLTSSA